MEGKKAKLIAVAVVLLVAVELTLLLCFGFSRPFYLPTAVILSAALAGTVTVLLCQALRRHGRAERMARRPVLDGGGGGDEEAAAVRVEYSYFRKVAGLPSRFSLEALSAATDGFQYVVGRGSSGTVFKGILDDGTPVAVKRIDDASAAHVDKEFKSEVSAIGSVQHVSLVRLLGFCLVRNGGPRFLVYEYMENGSLDRWIFPQQQHAAAGGAGGGGRWLTWVQRYQVAVDVAKALAYLHHDCRAKVVHLDVKPENILLDDRLRGVLSDFGLSTLMGKEQSRVVTTVRGTTGYLAPEWLLGAGVTEMSDVYSYGMVLMEMLGGRRNLQAEPAGPSGGPRRWSYFPKLVADRAREGKVIEVLDRRLAASAAADEASVTRLAHVALWCAQEKPGARPTMARVVEMLEARGGGSVELPPPSDMILVDLLALDPAQAHRGGTGAGPFGLPPEPGSAASSAMSLGDSFAVSYLSGR